MPRYMTAYEMWNDGRSHEEIMRSLGASRQHVYSMIWYGKNRDSVP